MKLAELDWSQHTNFDAPAKAKLRNKLIYKEQLRNTDPGLRCWTKGSLPVPAGR
jgi:hypothetical protein